MNYRKYYWPRFYASGQVMHLFPLSLFSLFQTSWSHGTTKDRKSTPWDQVTCFFFFVRSSSYRKKKTTVCIKFSMVYLNACAFHLCLSNSLAKINKWTCGWNLTYFLLLFLSLDFKGENKFVGVSGIFFCFESDLISNLWKNKIF